MSCQAIQHELQVSRSHQSCINCRRTGLCPNYVPLAAGNVYPKCSLVIQPGGDKFAPLEPLADLAAECDFIYGVMPCTEDLMEATEADAACKYAVLTGVDVDPNMICWPEGTTQEMIDMYTCQAKCCLTFTEKHACQPVPDEYADLVDGARAAQAKANIAEKVA